MTLSRSPLPRLIEYQFNKLRGILESIVVKIVSYFRSNLCKEPISIENEVSL